MGLCSSNCPRHKKGVYLFPHTQKTETKKQLKTPKIVLRKPKERKKENHQEKVEINKIFKNYQKNQKQDKQQKLKTLKKKQKKQKFSNPQKLIKNPFQITRKKQTREKKIS
jgi:hypothetical protein